VRLAGGAAGAQRQRAEQGDRALDQHGVGVVQRDQKHGDAAQAVKAGDVRAVQGPE
jgi:hypothetical protein